MASSEIGADSIHASVDNYDIFYPYIFSTTTTWQSFLAKKTGTSTSMFVVLGKRDLLFVDKLIEWINITRTAPERTCIPC